MLPGHTFSFHYSSENLRLRFGGGYVNNPRLQLRDARDGIRTNYRESVREVERAFWVHFEDFSKDFYESELAAVDDMLAGLVDRRADRVEVAKDFSSIASASTQLIENIQSQQVGNDGSGNEHTLT